VSFILFTLYSILYMQGEGDEFRQRAADLQFGAEVRCPGQSKAEEGARGASAGMYTYTPYLNPPPLYDI
jgi:hypothetical protein